MAPEETFTRLAASRSSKADTISASVVESVAVDVPFPRGIRLLVVVRD